MVVVGGRRGCGGAPWAGPTLAARGVAPGHPLGGLPPLRGAGSGSCPCCWPRTGPGGDTAVAVGRPSSVARGPCCTGSTWTSRWRRQRTAPRTWRVWEWPLWAILLPSWSARSELEPTSRIRDRTNWLWMSSGCRPSGCCSLPARPTTPLGQCGWGCQWSGSTA